MNKLIDKTLSEEYGLELKEDDFYFLCQFDFGLGWNCYSLCELKSAQQ